MIETVQPVDSKHQLIVKDIRNHLRDITVARFPFYALGLHTSEIVMPFATVVAEDGYTIVERPDLKDRAKTVIQRVPESEFETVEEAFALKEKSWKEGNPLPCVARVKARDGRETLITFLESPTSEFN